MALVGKKLCSTSLDPVFHVPVNLQHLPMRRTKCVHEKQFLNLVNSLTLGFINVSSHLDCDVSWLYIYRDRYAFTCSLGGWQDIIKYGGCVLSLWYEDVQRTPTTRNLTIYILTISGILNVGHLVWTWQKNCAYSSVWYGAYTAHHCTLMEFPAYKATWMRPFFPILVHCFSFRSTFCIFCDAKSMIRTKLMILTHTNDYCEKKWP